MSSDLLDEKLIESIDEALSDLFGIVLKEPFYGYFQERFGIPREMIPSCLSKFVVALSETFGITGVLVFGNAVAKRLYIRFGLQFSEEPTYTLLDYVKELRTKTQT